VWGLVSGGRDVDVGVRGRGKKRVDFVPEFGGEIEKAEMFWSFLFSGIHCELVDGELRGCVASFILLVLVLPLVLMLREC
jgi:hypothetical protein